jgi:hypothetical protein
LARIEQKHALSNFTKKNMRKPFLLLAVLLASANLQAQVDTLPKVLAYKITEYMERINDSTVIVQVQLPDAWPAPIKDKQLGLLKHCYQQGVTLDTAAIGWGRCHLIKGDYCYFALHLYKNQQPSLGDLLYTQTKVPVAHDGILLGVMAHAIDFTDVGGTPFLQGQYIFTIDQQQQTALLDSMVSDIRYTGTAMLQQMPDQNQPIDEGIYKGQKLFTAMQAVTRSQLIDFLTYIKARPGKYAGHTWKISETFATWMVSGTPRVVGE